MFKEWQCASCATIVWQIVPCHVRAVVPLCKVACVNGYLLHVKPANKPYPLLSSVHPTGEDAALRKQSIIGKQEMSVKNHSLWIRKCVVVSHWTIQSRWREDGVNSCWKCQENMILAVPGGNKWQQRLYLSLHLQPFPEWGAAKQPSEVCEE